MELHFNLTKAAYVMTKVTDRLDVQIPERAHQHNTPPTL